MSRRATACALATLALAVGACGRYGPPQRAPLVAHPPAGAPGATPGSAAPATPAPPAAGTQSPAPPVAPEDEGDDDDLDPDAMGRELDFAKMHGAGNDFVVLDGLRGELPALVGSGLALDELARRLLDRRLGIGGDQLLIAWPSSAADFRMEIFNPDGSRAEMCANGIRAFTKWLRDRGYSARDELAVETLGGVVRPRWAGRDLVTVDMGLPVFAPERIPTRLGAPGTGPVLDAPLEVDGARWQVSSVSMGNPHAVLFVDDVETAPVASLGPRIERHPAFPNRVNVEFVERVDRTRLRQRTWERGTGETLACGSGACAVAVVSILRGVADRELTIALRGGELRIAWPANDASVIMTGPATEVYTGRISLEGG